MDNYKFTLRFYLPPLLLSESAQKQKTLILNFFFGRADHPTLLDMKVTKNQFNYFPNDEARAEHDRRARDQHGDPCLCDHD
jgi:hypothetical protein